MMSIMLLKDEVKVTLNIHFLVYLQSYVVCYLNTMIVKLETETKGFFIVSMSLFEFWVFVNVAVCVEASSRFMSNITFCNTVP